MKVLFWLIFRGFKALPVIMNHYRFFISLSDVQQGVPFYEDSQKQKELKAGEESCSKIIFSTFYEYKNMQRKCVFEFSKSIYFV